MNLNINTPEKYQHKDGRKVTNIIPIKKGCNTSATHLIEFDNDTACLWMGLHTYLIETANERWQGIHIDDTGIIAVASYFELSLKSIPSVYTHGVNLNTLKIVKL